MTWLNENPDIQFLQVAACDLNGQARGKLIPRKFAAKALSDGTRFPFSILNLDMSGADIKNSPIVFESGDPDGILRPTERGPVALPWLNNSALLPVWMFEGDTPFSGDPRHALVQILARYKNLGLTPLTATELEFYLLDNHGQALRAAADPITGQPAQSDTLSLTALDAFEPFFTDLYAGAEAMNIPADTATSEAAPGQFEINLMHSADALETADNTWLFKMLIKGTARKHGLTATFLAKPFPDQGGNGMHTHFSILDAQGENVFASNPSILKHAIAGCLAAMDDSTLIFAPHGNSYTRLAPNSHAPTSICWGNENRTTALRIPGGASQATRIEHRVSGGDANPYLMLASILGAALWGIENKMTPAAETIGNAYTQDLPQISSSWSNAIDGFENSTILPNFLPKPLIENLTATKRQEARNDDAKTRIQRHLDTA